MAETPITLSILDRLCGMDLDERGYRLRGREQSLLNHRASVQRGLDWLLNTRRTPEEAGDEYPETQRSLFHYGIPDMSSLSAESVEVRRQLAREIKEAVGLFEPRLSQVRVVWLDPAQSDAGTESEGEVSRFEYRFRIDAVLMLDPEPERVSFDAVLDSVQGEFQVQGGSDA